MKTFNIHLTRTLTETAVVSMDAKTHAEAVEKVLDQYHEGQDEYNFMQGDCDIEAAELGGNADDDLSPNSRADKVKRLIEAGDYEEENAVCDMLADLRHYCETHDIDFAEEDRRAYGHYCAERQEAA